MGTILQVPCEQENAFLNAEKEKELQGKQVL